MSGAAILQQLQPVIAQESSNSKQKDDEPFSIEVRKGYGVMDNTIKHYVLIASSTTVRQLAQAIHCELNVDALSMRLVMTGKTIYNAHYANSIGPREHRTVKEASASQFEKAEPD